MSAETNPEKIKAEWEKTGGIRRKHVPESYADAAKQIRAHARPTMSEKPDPKEKKKTLRLGAAPPIRLSKAPPGEEPSTDKERFFDLLKKAAQPVEKPDGKTSE